MGTYSWIRAAAALLLLVTMAGVAVPCADLPSPGAAGLSMVGLSSGPAGGASDCHCVCHTSWIPVQLRAGWGSAPVKTVETPVPAAPEGSCIPVPGEPPRSA